MKNDPFEPFETLKTTDTNYWDEEIAGIYDYRHISIEKMLELSRKAMQEMQRKGLGGDDESWAIMHRIRREFKDKKKKRWTGIFCCQICRAN